MPIYGNFVAPCEFCNGATPHTSARMLLGTGHRTTVLCEVCGGGSIVDSFPVSDAYGPSFTICQRRATYTRPVHPSPEPIPSIFLEAFNEDR